MKAFAVVLIVLALVGCRHKKAKDASDEDKDDKESSAKTSAPAGAKCDVKGFAYSVPAPGPITDGGAQ